MLASAPSIARFTPPTENELRRALRARPQQKLDIGHSRVAAWTFGPDAAEGVLDVLFIHGWPLDAATFRRIVPHLASTFRCHLIDLPGVGQSESDASAPVDLVSHAASVRTAVDRLGLERYAVLAHDSGGFVARLLAAEDPRVAGLVLADTEIPGFMSPLLAGLVLASRLPRADLLLRAMLGSRMIRRSALGFGGCFEDPDYIDSEFFGLFVEPLLRDERVLRRQLRVLQTLSREFDARLTAAHERIRVPVQLLWGTDDPFFPIAKARAMVSTFKGPVEFESLRGAKLFPHEDRPEQFAGFARGFLERV
ncbi:MAG: alpha/beta hydrolase [Polyangiaceae bacterium]